MLALNIQRIVQLVKTRPLFLNALIAAILPCNNLVLINSNKSCCGLMYKCIINFACYCLETYLKDQVGHLLCNR